MEFFKSPEASLLQMSDQKVKQELDLKYSKKFLCIFSHLPTLLCIFYTDIIHQ
jgi:hypothetical protein